MSIIISNIALHFLAKQEETSEVSLTLGPETIEVSDKITQFIDALHHIYNSKGNKAYGRFTATSVDAEQRVFSELMEDYLNDQLSYYQFSAQAANLLKNELDKYALDETGYLILCHYEFMGGRYILATIVPVTEHFSVDGQLNISADRHLDTSGLQLAARIDLFDYQDNAEGNRYISFIKGRAGRKVSDFFLDFLGCEEGINAKEQTQTLVQAVEDYVAVNQLDASEKQQTRKDLLNYCKEQKQNDQDVSLKELDDVIKQTGDETSFHQFCQAQAYDIEETFPHDQSVVNKATKYSGYGAGISISFERGHLGQEVVYDSVNDNLTIYKVPPNLKNQLLALLENSQTSVDE